jgi:hypothetical protein
MSHTRPWFAYPAALLIVGSMYLGFVSAQTDDKKKQPAPAFELPKVLRDHATKKTAHSSPRDMYLATPARKAPSSFLAMSSIKAKASAKTAASIAA